jgi:hypothetical protein
MRGRYHNELTQFRYNVILHIGGETVSHPGNDSDQNAGLV